jgi:hypothetical protein
MPNLDVVANNSLHLRSDPRMAGSAAIGIMCKAPLSGRVKTGLAAMIGPEEAATLSACFLRVWRSRAGNEATA